MRIVFCGVGALGSTAISLCRNLDAQLVAIDDDHVESKNLLAQMYVKQSVGKPKAQALRLQLQNFYGVAIEAHPVRVTARNVDTLLEDANLVVDCFDNAESRRVLSDSVAGSGTPLLHAGVSGDGTFGIVRWEENFVPDEEDTPGQATCEGGEHLPLIGLLGAAIARAVQDFVASQDRHEYMVTLTGIQQLETA